MSHHDEAMRRGFDAASRLLDAELRRHGLEGEPGIAVGWTDEGTVRLVREYQSARGLEQSQSNLVTTVDPERPLDPRSVFDIGWHARMFARRKARQAALARHGVEEPNAPAWAFTVHAAIASVLRHAGLPLGLATRGRSSAQWLALSQLAEQQGVTLGDAATADDRVTVSFVEPPDRAFSVEGIGRTWIRVQRELPESVMLAMAGRRLGDVLGHEALRGAAKVRVASAEAGESGTRIHLADSLATLARPPAGAGGWRRIVAPAWPGSVSI